MARKGTSGRLDRNPLTAWQGKVVCKDKHAPATAAPATSDLDLLVYLTKLRNSLSFRKLCLYVEGFIISNVYLLFCSTLSPPPYACFESVQNVFFCR